MATFDPAVRLVLKHEGGYSDDPHDSGGRTNLGVTQRVYEDWVKHPVSEAIMRGLTVQHVRALYKANYWDAVKGNDLSAGLDLCVFDFAVNAGVNRAARYLQLMVGAVPDGVIGPSTMRQLQQYLTARGPEHAIERYQELRAPYYQKLAQFPRYGRGWLRRVAAVTKAALAAARGAKS